MKIKKEICRHYGKKIFEWCIKKYGYSKHYKFISELVFRKKDACGDKLKGEHTDCDEIVVYLDEVKNISDLVKTIIHEYTHYIQSPVWFQRYYKLEKTFENHPYEIQAEKIAERDFKECLDDILKQ